MTTTQNITAAREAKAAAMTALAKAAPRTKRAVLAAVESADMDLAIAIRQHEQAVRAANPGATEAEIQRIVRAA